MLDRMEKQAGRQASDLSLGSMPLLYKLTLSLLIPPLAFSDTHYFLHRSPSPSLPPLFPTQTLFLPLFFPTQLSTSPPFFYSPSSLTRILCPSLTSASIAGTYAGRCFLTLSLSLPHPLPSPSHSHLSQYSRHM